MSTFNNIITLKAIFFGFGLEFLKNIFNYKYFILNVSIFAIYIFLTLKFKPKVTLITLIITIVNADVVHILNKENEPVTPSPPAKPYVFSYSAGRSPGTVDRTHTEVSDGSGVIRGAFSYVDPRNELRTVKYVADKNGFHPQLSHELKDTEANRRATEKHLKLYNKIAQAHADAKVQDAAQIQTDHLVEPEKVATFAEIAAAAAPNAGDTEAVKSAKKKYINLYEKITEEHAKIAAEREAIEAESNKKSFH